MTETLDGARIADRYFAAWNAPESERGAAVLRAYVADAYYCDPLTEARGVDAIAMMIGTVLDQFPGASFRLASTVDQHHHQTRFDWALVDASGAEQLSGIDVVVTDDAGAITHVLGFFGRTPAPFPGVVPSTG